MTTPNELSEYTKKTIREHEEWNKDWWLCLPDELFDFIEQEILQEILEAERRMKQRCLECIPEKKDMPDHECATFECEHYPRTDTHNMLVDKITTAISSLK